MCGRFSFAFTKKIIEERFDLEEVEDYVSRYNCAPSQHLAVITSQKPKTLSYFKWGLIPYWAKDASIGSKLINAKAETILEKPSFKNAFIHRRCLIPCDSFYEWSRDKGKKPFRFFLSKKEPFAMAGIWDSCEIMGAVVNTFSIITCRANELMLDIHERMPVILDKKSEHDWLFSTEIDSLINLLTPYPSQKMEFSAISKLVNSVKNDSVEIHKNL